MPLIIKMVFCCVHFMIFKKRRERAKEGEKKGSSYTWGYSVCPP